METVLGKPLTDSEVQTVKAVLAGYTYHKEIANYLGISTTTVSGRLSAIFAKTGACNLADLVLMALGRKIGAVDLSDIAESVLREQPCKPNH